MGVLSRNVARMGGEGGYEVCTVWSASPLENGWGWGGGRAGTVPAESEVYQSSREVTATLSPQGPNRGRVSFSRKPCPAALATGKGADSRYSGEAWNRGRLAGALVLPGTDAGLSCLQPAVQIRDVGDATVGLHCPGDVAVAVGFLWRLEEKHFQGPTREDAVWWQDLFVIQDKRCPSDGPSPSVSPWK